VTYRVACVSLNGQWMTGVGHYCLFLREDGVSDQALVMPTDLYICVYILFIAGDNKLLFLLTVQQPSGCCYPTCLQRSLLF
jgi:hypothetical protein